MKDGLSAIQGYESDISALAESFPYCATYQIMKALADQGADHLDYKRSRSLAAIYAQDRSKLYTYMLEAQLNSQIEKFESQVSECELQDVTTANKSEIETSETEIENKASFISAQPLEDEIMRAAISQLSELETADYIATLPLISVESPNYSPIERGELSFGEWLLKLSDKKAPVATSGNKADLIDKFIAEAPQISPVKAAFFSPSQVAKLSLVEDDMFVTETLAKIYMRQGHYKKAVKAFEILTLKYPEKTRYFAALKKEAEEQGLNL